MERKLNSFLNLTSPTLTLEWHFGENNIKTYPLVNLLMSFINFPCSPHQLTAQRSSASRLNSTSFSTISFRSSKCQLYLTLVVLLVSGVFSIFLPVCSLWASIGAPDLVRVHGTYSITVQAFIYTISFTNWISHLLKETSRILTWYIHIGNTPWHNHLTL